MPIGWGHGWFGSKRSTMDREEAKKLAYNPDGPDPLGLGCLLGHLVEIILAPVALIALVLAWRIGSWNLAIFGLGVAAFAGLLIIVKRKVFRSRE